MNNIDSETPGMRACRQLREAFPDSNDIPENLDLQQLFHLLAKGVEFQSNCKSCLKMVPLDEITTEKLNKYVNEKVNKYSKCEELSNLEFTLKMGYYYQCIFQQIDTITQTLGIEKYNKFSAQFKKKYNDFSKILENHSANSVKECLYANVGLKWLKLMPKAYLKMNILDEDELWWIKAVYISDFLTDAKALKSYESCHQIKGSVTSFVEDISNFLTSEAEVNNAITEFNGEIIDEQIKNIMQIASQSFEKMKPMQIGFAKYKKLILTGMVDNWENEIDDQQLLEEIRLENEIKQKNLLNERKNYYDNINACLIS